MNSLPDLSKLLPKTPSPSHQHLRGAIEATLLNSSRTDFTAEWKTHTMVKDSGVKTVSTPHRKNEAGNVIYALGPKPPFDHVSPKVGVAISSQQRGLGLYAIDDIEPDEFLCFYTGVWTWLSDLDSSFGTQDPCVNRYTASHFTATPFDKDHVDQSTGVYGKMKGGGEKARYKPIDRIVVTPRFDAESFKNQMETKEMCPLELEAPTCDVAALINNVEGNKGNSDINCQPRACYVFDNEVHGTALRPVVIMESTIKIKKGVEIVFNYGYRSEYNKKEEYEGSVFDLRKHTMPLGALKSIIAIQEKKTGPGTNNILYINERQSMPWVLPHNGLKVYHCGPSIYPMAHVEKNDSNNFQAENVTDATKVFMVTDMEKGAPLRDFRAILIGLPDRELKGDLLRMYTTMNTLRKRLPMNEIVTQQYISKFVVNFIMSPIITFLNTTVRRRNLFDSFVTL